MHKTQKAISDLIIGKPILLYDFKNREDETDLIYYGPTITAKSVYDLRITAGAPLSLYIDYESSLQLGISIFSKLIRSLDISKYKIMHELVKPVGNIDPRFSLTLDYRGNKTGCSHFETARTIQKLYQLIKHKRYNEFSKEFRSPGHIPLIISSPNLLKDRKGHTELIMSLLKWGNLLPLVGASEIINRYSCHSLNYSQAKAFASSNNLVFLEGNDINNLGEKNEN